MEDLVDSFADKFEEPLPVISQLAVAIEETLVVYHEPYFIRWACRCLQGIVDKNFDPNIYMPSEYRASMTASTWAEMAAFNCVEAAKQPVLDAQIVDAAAAIECALRAQDVMGRTKEKDCSKDE